MQITRVLRMWYKIKNPIFITYHITREFVLQTRNLIARTLHKQFVSFDFARCAGGIDNEVTWLRSVYVRIKPRWELVLLTSSFMCVALY
jgi:hypothetical protein